MTILKNHFFVNMSLKKKNNNDFFEKKIFESNLIFNKKVKR